MIRRALFLFLALTLAGATAACGGGGGDGSAKTDKSTSDDEEGQIGDAASAPNSSRAGESDGDGSGTDSATEPDDGSPPAEGTMAPIPEYTGAGSEDFCGQMSTLQSSVEGADPSTIDYADLANKMSAITPPAELANDWGIFLESQKMMGSDPTGGSMENLDEAKLTAYGQANSNVSAYLVSICGL
ncbi:MAG TPA: hypothetical protein VFI47_01385 [Acidimicrobiales bacterium]|nr:hypothetical protein [Acidimicrobiales bacterium]